MIARHNSSNDVFVLAYGGEGGIVLDPAQHVGYTALDHRDTSDGPGLGVLLHRRGHLFMTPISSHILVDLSTKSRYNVGYGREIHRGRRGEAEGASAAQNAQSARTGRAKRRGIRQHQQVRERAAACPTAHAPQARRGPRSRTSRTDERRGVSMPAPGDRITKRKDGRWMGRHTVPTPTGTKRKPVYGRTYNEAEKKLALAMGDAARGIVYDDENQTVGEYMTQSLSYSAKHSMKANTYRDYESQIRNHIIPALGKGK